MLSMKACIVFISLFALASCYKPVILMHGLGGDAGNWNDVVAWLDKAHPDQLVTALTTDSDNNSSKIMSEQVQDVTSAIKAAIQLDPSAYNDGFHLVGHSQGGLLTRAVLMESGFNIINYVSCAGAQYGVYGNYSSQYTPAQITDVLYTPEAQNSTSYANYWHDPDYERYVTNALFLSTLNNETYNPNSEQNKKNFLSANVTVFNISPQDGGILPWQSAIFGFWAPNVSTIVDMEDQLIYLNDSFGLKTANERGSLVINVVPGVGHMGWLQDPTIFANYVLPYLT